MIRSFYILLVVVVVATIAFGATPAALDVCSSLMGSASLNALPNTTITSAETVSGMFTPPNGKPIEGLPSFCRVTATLKPSPASDIRVEVWLPSAGWNGKLEGVGNGGLAGSITYTSSPNGPDHASLADAVRSGYVGVSTDTGHVVSDRTWQADMEREEDYGYRAVHGMTVTAKAVAQAFYGSDAKRSYFNGCSAGGGQAFAEAEVYPQDYDGILAGAAQLFQTHSRALDLWQYQLVSNNPDGKLSKPTLAFITKAVLKRCGSSYGAEKDGFLSSDPRECKFDPAQLLCKPGDDASACLTPAQVKIVGKIYEGFKLPGTNKVVMAGLPVGTEGPDGPGNMGWDRNAYMAGDSLANTSAGQFYGLGVLNDPNADLGKIDIPKALEMADEKFGFVNHTNTNLDPFIGRGGKLIMYHGLADATITVFNSINYYSSFVDSYQERHRLDHNGALAGTQKSVRFFLVPGMGHCGGGPGLASFDPLTALDKWVDSGTAPDTILASHVANGTKVMTRPLCAYPKLPNYSGTGDRNDPSNWTCATGHWDFERHDRY